MVPLSPELAKRNNADPEAYEYARLPERLDGGVVIANVYPDSPAERAGLCKMDVVIALGGRKVRGTREMQASIDGARIGQSLEVDILRNGKEMSLNIHPEDLEVKLREVRGEITNSKSATDRGLSEEEIDNSKKGGEGNSIFNKKIKVEEKIDEELNTKENEFHGRILAE